MMTRTRKKRKYIDVLEDRVYPLTAEELEEVERIRIEIKPLENSFAPKARKICHEKIERLQQIYDPYFQYYRNRQAMNNPKAPAK